MDADRLRVNFCSMILQAKGDTISHFVAWLDLKVAEYKVYGHMILTDSDENSASWSAGNDPSQWPRSKEGGNVQLGSAAFLSQHNSTVGASQPRSYSGLSFNRRGNHGTAARRGRGGVNRARPARPKSVVANILKNAISRSVRTPALPPTPSASIATSQQMESSPLTTSASDSAVNTTVATVAVADASSAEQSAVAIKMEQDQNIVMLDSDSEGEDVKPAVSEAGDSSLWLSESAGTLDRYGGGASVSAGEPVTSVSHLVPGMPVPHMMSPQVARPVHKPMLTPTTPRAGPSTGPSPLSAKRTPGARDSVTELLETHTVQTDSDVYQCGICGTKLTKLCNLYTHIRSLHIDKDRFKCEYCPKVCSRRDHLQSHQERYHDMTVKPQLRCIYCNGVFGGEKYYRLHMSRLHPDIVNDDPPVHAISTDLTKDGQASK